MGYRSQVVAAFYAAEVKDFPVLKLWLNENFPMKEFGNCVRWFNRGMLFELDDVKWYDNYPDIKSFNEAVETFRDLFCVGNAQMLAGAYEFMRIGEDYEDIETMRDGDYDYVLNCLRSIDIDI